MYSDLATGLDEYRRILERLREARLAAGLTQTQVAERLGKPQSFVSKVELGERQIDPSSSGGSRSCTEKRST